jgi:hypothetical protein
VVHWNCEISFSGMPAKNNWRSHKYFRGQLGS